MDPAEAHRASMTSNTNSSHHLKEPGNGEAETPSVTERSVSPQEPVTMVGEQYQIEDKVKPTCDSNGSGSHEVVRLKERDSQHDSHYYSITSNRTSLRTFYTTISRQTMNSRDSGASRLSRRTPWRQILYDKKLIVDKFNETDWSGRGQHAEFGPHEASLIDELLTPEGVLGHSSTALVEKVRCKRVMLARKKVRCSWRLSREEVIDEVAHLQRLSHAHIVRAVGTYVIGKELSILLYPATSHNLETFLDQYADLIESRSSPMDLQTMFYMRESILRFFTCLHSTISFLHQRRVKHMDIKPTNILVQTRDATGLHKVYLADFGISRSYSSDADAETDSRTPFSRTYASPEVVRQDVRGFSADIFSLGCVFLEMLATITRSKHKILAVRARHPAGDMSYQANLHHLVQSGLLRHHEAATTTPVQDHNGLTIPGVYPSVIGKMMAFDRNLRPTAAALNESFPNERACCLLGPEPFEAANVVAVSSSYHQSLHNGSR